MGGQVPLPPSLAGGGGINGIVSLTVDVIYRVYYRAYPVTLISYFTNSQSDVIRLLAVLGIGNDGFFYCTVSVSVLRKLDQFGCFH